MTTDKAARKARPIARGVLDYFPDAIAEIAHVSYVGNQQHNPGEELHWAKDKSTDHADCILRHLIERGTIDADDGLRHTAKVAWRALALLQVELDAEKAIDLDKCGTLDGTTPLPDQLDVHDAAYVGDTRHKYDGLWNDAADSRKARDERIRDGFWQVAGTAIQFFDRYGFAAPKTSISIAKAREAIDTGEWIRCNDLGQAL